MYNLFRDCIVRLRTPSDRGTGFFVAPGILLTCHHVVGKTEPGEIEVNWHDSSYHSWKVDTIEQLDLALVWVEIAGHPCVYLDRDAQPGDELYSYGYPDQDRDGASITLECEGPSDKGQLLTIKDENVRPGFSGAPLLNQRTLKVCGMIQRERQIKVNANPKIFRALGGQAVPTGVILAQWPELEEQNRRFHQQDKRWLEQIPISCPHNLPRSGVVKFVGRDEVLATLHQQLQQNEPVAISAVAGMGGIGKTELALQYAWRHREEYRGGICWLQGSEVGAKHWGDNLSVEPKVSSPNALPSEDVNTDFRVATEIINFAQIYLKLKIRDDLDLRGQVKDCWQYWFSLIQENQEKVLVIIDNVTSYQEIKDYLPPANSQFRVLLTTRKQLGKPVQVLSLDELDEASALELLKSLTSKARIEAELADAKKLCRWLGYLPLGLELVGRYLAEEEDLSLEAMLSRLQDQGVQNRALALNPHAAGISTADRGVAAAFELSWETLAQTAQQLGCLLSLFALAPIPWNLVEQVIKVCNLPPPSGNIFQRLISNLPFFNKTNHQSLSSLSQLETTAILEEARSSLRLLHLIQRSDQNTYQLHPLIREFFRYKGEESAEVEGMKQGLAAVMVAVAKKIPQSITLESVEIFQPAIPHLQEVARELLEYVTDENLITPCNRLGWFYNGQGLYELAEPWFEECKAVAETRLGNKHPDFATSLNNLASLYESQGRYSEAEPLYKEAIAIDKQSLPPNHPQLATNLNNLALLYKSQGRYSEAEPLYKDAITIKKQSLPPNHPDLAINFNNLALLYKSQGRYSEAEPLYQDAIAIIKESLPPNHPSLATNLNNLASLYESQGQYSEAEPLYIEAIAIVKQSLPPNHPYLASSLNNLAGLYKSQGRYSEAEPLYKDAIAIVKQSLPPNHPSLAINFNNLARLYESQGRYSEAEPLYLEALDILFHSLGSEHLNTVKGWNNFVYFLEKVVREGKESVLSEHPMVQEELAKIKESGV
ncbi:MAG: tetratricopeptide repeat protein [Symploca sp. SIO2D2]|nr:tetratricopeptide repeat protein [Symploca sp. SIO2D2]